MTRRLDISDLPRLAALLGAEWIERTVAGQRRQGEHPLKSFWDQTFTGRDDLLAALDRAVGVLEPGLGVTTDGRNPRRRLAEKLRNAPQFWSAVAEVVWGARLSAIGRVTIEPFDKGPDFRVDASNVAFYVEVYSPVSARNDVHEDVEFRITRWAEKSLPAGRGIRVHIIDDHVERQPSVVHPLVSELKREILRVRRGDAETVAIFRTEAAGWTVLDGLDEREIAWRVEFGPLAAFVSSPPERPIDDLYVVTSSTSSRTPSESPSPYRGLSQLVPDARNVLVVDHNREFLTPEWTWSEVLHGPAGPFSRHPELSAIVFSRWGALLMSDGDHHHGEEYGVVATKRTDAQTLPATILQQLLECRLF